MREVAEASLRLTDGALQLVDRRLPERGLGADGLRRARRRAALGRGRDAPCGSTSPTRSPPGASTSRRSARRAAALNDRRFDALRYRGPGHRPDRRPASRLRLAGGARRVARDRARREHADRGGLHGARTRAASTGPCARRYPLQIQGTIVRGLEVRFEGGRAVEVRADEGEELMRTHVATDDGAARLGEVALVDGRLRASARPGSSSTTRSSTRTPRRTSRSAWRSCRPSTGATSSRRGAPRARASTTRSIHTDFMIGSHELAVGGVTDDGEEVPILRDGDWQLRVAAAVAPDVLAPGSRSDGGTRRGKLGGPPRRSGRADSNCDFSLPKAALYQAELRPVAAQCRRSRRGRSLRARERGPASRRAGARTGVRGSATRWRPSAAILWAVNGTSRR